MRIGIVYGIDNSTLLPFIEDEKDKELVRNNCSVNGAPSVNTLVHSFLKNGHFVRVFTTAAKNFVVRTKNLEIFATETYEGYPIKYLWGCFLTAKNIERIIRGKIQDLDVLHAHWSYSNAYAAMRFADQIPVFCTVRDVATYIWRIESLKNKVTWSFKVLMNYLVLKNKKIHIIANSQYTAIEIKKRYKISAPIIPNSIKDSFVKSGKHINPERFTVLCISSSNDKRKNVITLLRAFRMLSEKHPDIILRLVGAAFSSENKDINKWKRQDLLKNVELVGKVLHSQLTEYLDKSSVFVSPSLEETFGNTLLESIVRRVPVIGGEASGAVPFVLHHGKAGFLCDVSDPVELCNTMEYVLLHENDAKRMSDSAYNIILSEYSESVICQKHIDLYENYIK